MRFHPVKLLVAALAFAAVPTAGAFEAPTELGAPAQDTAVDSNADPLLAGADLARGKAVFQRIGICVNCHGWDGNGMGRNPRAEGAAALLRNTQLDTQALIDVIRCGLPGTTMPFHDSTAYRNAETCFGMVMADFEAGAQPHKGKTFRDKDLISLVAYMKDAIIGKGETTLEECEAYFEPGAEACNSLR